MKQRLFLKFYRDFNIWNLIFSVISGIYLGAFSGLLVFCSFGMLIGLIGFRYFRNNEYYIYYNLGVTKVSLLKRVWLVNVALSVPVLIVLSLAT